MAIGDKRALPLAVCNKVPDENGNITLSVADIAELEAALLNKANTTETIYYIGDTPATPDTTGFPSLSEYLKDMFHKGFRGVCGPIVDFEELPVKQWGYGMLATSGEGGYVWDIEIFRSLTSTKQYRQLNAHSGGWIMDGWEEYATKTDLAGKANVYPNVGQISMSAPPSQYPQGITFAELTGEGAVPGVTVTFQGINEWRTFQIIGMEAGAPHFRVNTVTTPATWTDLVPLATATPPEEHALPLAEGVQENPGYRARYSKSQDSKVLIICNALCNSYFTNGSIVCTMPAGYRVGPNNQKRSATITTIEGVIHPAKVVIDDVTGSITLHYNAGVANVHQVDFEANYIAADYGPNALQSQVRMPTARMARTAIPEEPVNKCMCVVDADSNYVEFVMVTISHDELGALYTVHYYELQEGERLVDSPVPPTKRAHAGVTGLLRPIWDDDAAAWTEGATEAEIIAWELEHPAPEPAGPDRLTQTQLAVAELAQVVEDSNTANQLAIAELAEATMGGEPGGESVL